MLDKLKEDAEYYLGWYQRKVIYFKEEYEKIKELRDQKSMQLKYIFKADIIRSMHEVAYIKCFLLDPKDIEARGKIEKDLMDEVKEFKLQMKNE